MVDFTGENAINGRFGSLFVGGLHLANIQNIEARPVIDRRDIQISGTFKTAYKRMGFTGEGTFTIWRVNTLFNDVLNDMKDPKKKTPILQMDIGLNDPDSGGEEKISLSGVKLWEFPQGFSTDDLVSQAISFTFEDIKWEIELDPPPQGTDYPKV